MDKIKEKARILAHRLANMASDTKDKAEDVIEDVLDWMIQNPEAAAGILVPISIAGIRSSQSLIVSHRLKKEHQRADRTWYDRSTGLRWDLRRKMTNRDRLIISQMKSQGVETIDILTRLRLI